MARYRLISFLRRSDSRVCGEVPRAEDSRDRYPHLLAVLEEFLCGRKPMRTVGRQRKTAPFQPGHTIEDFQIVRTLGQTSAFASVYLARQLSIQRLVALKVSLHGSDEPKHFRSSITSMSFASMTNDRLLIQTQFCFTCSTCQAEHLPT